MHDEGHQEDEQEQEEQDLRNSRRRGREATESEHAGDDRDNEKYECPTQHEKSPLQIERAAALRLLTCVFRSFVEGITSRTHIFADTLDRVASREAQRENSGKNSQQGGGRFHGNYPFNNFEGPIALELNSNM